MRACPRALGEAEVVLDASARSRLSSERPAVEHDHGQPFGGGVDGRRKPGRPRPDDRDVVGAVGMVEAPHAECPRQVGLGRILEKRAVGADDEGYVRLACLVVLEQHCGLVIRGGIEHPMGTGIARQEALEADEVGMDGRADQHGATAARLDQAGAAQEQRAHDPLTDLRFGNQHGSETVAGNEEHLGVAVGPSIREARLAGEHARLRQEAAGPQLDDVQDVAETVPGAQADRPRDEDEHRGVDVPRPEQQLAGGVAADRSEPPEPVDLLRAQAREHLFQPGVRDGHQVLLILSRTCDPFSRRAMRPTHRVWLQDRAILESRECVLVFQGFHDFSRT